MRAVLPTIVTQLLSGARSVRLGNLEPKRDLTFVSDTVDGFVRAGAAPGVEGEVIQLGTGVAVSIGELFQAACRGIGSYPEIEAQPERIRPAKSEVMELLSHPARARQRLGWTPTVDLEQGLRLTADWFSEHLTRYRADRYYV
jgi:UDP-glucose 4-epimerase